MRGSIGDSVCSTRPRSSPAALSRSGERVLPTGDAAIGSSLATLGAVETGRGKLDVAERLLARAVAILEAKDGPDSLATARARSDYGQVLFWKGDGVRSEALERRVYETFRRELGDDNVQTAIHLGNLGVLLDEIDRLPEAEAAYRKSHGGARETPRAGASDAR